MVRRGRVVVHPSVPILPGIAGLPGAVVSPTGNLAGTNETPRFDG
jgi:hypothetical protein